MARNFLRRGPRSGEDARRDAVCDEVRKLGAAAASARREVDRRLGRLDATLAEEPARQRALNAILADPQLTPAAACLRPLLDRLGAAARAIRTLRPPALGPALGHLEQDVAAYRETVAALAAWFRVRAATAPPARHAGLDEPGIRDDLRASLGLDRALLPTADLAIRCDLLIRTREADAAVLDATEAAARPDATEAVRALRGAALAVANRDSEAAAEFRAAFDREGDPDMLCRAALSLLVAGRHEEALEVAEDVLRIDPRHVKALDLRADALKFLTRFEEAREAYGALTELPGAPDVRVDRAQVLAALGRDDELDEVLRSLLAEDLGAARKTATAFYLVHRYADAAFVAHAALEYPGLLGPDAARLERLLPALDAAVGRLEDALDRLDGQLAANERDGDVHECRAIVLGGLGRSEEAIAAIDRAVELRPERSEYLGTLGRLRRWAGDPVAALAPIECCVEARPRRIEGLTERACCLTQLGRFEEARAILDALPAWSDRDPFALYARAALASAERRMQDAIEILRRASRIRPEMDRRRRIDPLFAGLRLAERAAPWEPVVPEPSPMLVGWPRLGALAALLASAAGDAAPGMEGRLVAAARGCGDTGSDGGETGPSEMSHWLYVPGRAAADAAAAELRAAGYDTEVQTSPDGAADLWSVHATKAFEGGAEAFGALADFMERLAAKYRGEYDGWEMAVG